MLVQAVRPMAWMGRRSSLLARYAEDATRRLVAARHLTEEARAKRQHLDSFGDSGGDTTQRTTHTDTFNL